MHKGSKALAYEMIRRFSEAGATICKFQFGWTKEAQEAMGLEYNAMRYIDEWAGDLKKWCDYFGVELMASIWSMEGLETARRVEMKRYKIAHQLWREPNSYDLLQEILGDNKETFISHSSHDVTRAGMYALDIYVSPYYPTYPDGTLDIPEQFGYYYGYSDHSHGIAPCLLAVARGALYIEKHVTLDKSDLTVRDTPFSADPQEFAEMTRLGREMRRLLDEGV